MMRSIGLPLWDCKRESLYFEVEDRSGFYRRGGESSVEGIRDVGLTHGILVENNTPAPLENHTLYYIGMYIYDVHM